MQDITYKIQFFAEWHCGSGLSSGADVDALVIRDENGLPFVPGKTLKGLLRDAAELLNTVGQAEIDQIQLVFGVNAQRTDGPPKAGVCSFSNAELSGSLQEKLISDKTHALNYLFRSHSSTAIDSKGQAEEHNLRRSETVIPLALYARIYDVPEEALPLLKKCMQYTKRLGVNRNRGLGRCDLTICEEVSQ